MRRDVGPPDQKFFIDRSIPVPEAGCWLWEGCVGRDGYGQVRTLGKTQGAHREAYRAFKGDLPKGLHVMHSCDTRLCVNPAHLSLGTKLVNKADRIKLYEAIRGERDFREVLAAHT